MSEAFRFTKGERQGMLLVAGIVAVVAMVSYVRRPEPVEEHIPATESVATEAPAVQDSASSVGKRGKRAKAKAPGKQGRKRARREARSYETRDVRDEDVTAR